MDVDLGTLVVAVLALGVSVMTVTAHRRQHRRETFLRLEDQLMSSELRRGRRLLFEAAKVGSLPADGTDEFHLINQAIGAFDNAAIYDQMGLIPRGLIVKIWHHNLQDIRRGAEMMAERRFNEHHDWWPWPNLWQMLDDADRFKSSLRCCTIKRLNESQSQGS